MADSTPSAARRAWGGIMRALATCRGKIIAGGTVAVLVIAGGGGAVFAATRGGDAQYRTATAQMGHVSQTLALTGQISSQDSVSAAFQVSGTVADVLVKLGAKVTAGAKLATLNTDTLKAAVTSAQDTLASAQQQLQEDLASQASGTASTASTGSATYAHGSGTSSGSGSTGSRGGGGASTSKSDSTGSGSTGSQATGSGAPGSTGSGATDQSTTGSSTTPTSPAVLSAQHAVTAAQTALLAQFRVATSDEQDSSSATATAQTVCGPFLTATLNPDGSLDAGTGTGSDPTSTPTPPPTPTDAAGSGSDLTATQKLLASCQTALTTSLDAQKTTAAAQQTLQKKATALNSAVAALLKALGAADSSDSSARTPSTSGAPSSPNAKTSSYTYRSTPTITVELASTDTVAAAVIDSGSSGASGAGQTSHTITAADILSDQAQIDVAEADVSVAKQNVGFATLTSPIAGTVVAVDMAAGNAVAAASTSETITVQGAGGYAVQTTVPLAKIASVTTGQSVSIVLPAFAKTYSGTVASIGVLNVSQTSTPSYTVTLAVDTGADTPRIGATAQATVTLSTAQDVLTVPTSAVTVSGASATVTVLKNGTPTRTVVQIGAVGAARTEVAKGLSKGAVVVLADLDQQISTGTTSTSLTNLGGRTRQFGAGFTGAGGFPTGEFSGTTRGTTTGGN
ncbi:hypothetical protein GCM10022240_09520 [Microbacterium kribbense]|uniref:HlyD family efflux transporter periplasmic adaptor subunit n=1 Tax=Microbacterium kribbense TaxID=433645 RepID=A0ABP7G8C1_9MICO